MAKQALTPFPVGLLRLGSTDGKPEAEEGQDGSEGTKRLGGRGPPCADPKSVLGAMLQKLMERPVAKGDIIFENHVVTGGYQSTAKISAVPGKEVSGEVKSSKKEAEQSAAHICLQIFKDYLKIPDETLAAVQAEMDARAAVRKGSRLPYAYGDYWPPSGASGDYSESVGLPPGLEEAVEGKAAAKGMSPVAIEQMKQIFVMVAGYYGWQGSGKGWGKGGPPKGGQGALDDDPKSKLMAWLQHHLQRSLTKDDVVWRTTQVEGGWQATMVLVCMQSEEFVGEACPNTKAAERSAAKQALQRFAAEITKMPPAPRKSKASHGSGDASGWIAPRDPDTKNQLVAFLQRYLGRSLTKADVEYDTVTLGDRKFQSKLTLRCINGEQLIGQPAETAKAAEREAAAVVLQAFAEQAKEQAIGPRPQL